ncbi:MAG: hypothetical protein HW384_1651 [Dehalococcoidia bacterium]|nr:hypothetical protein [Dehalococcoidia bacterium]
MLSVDKAQEIINNFPVGRAIDESSRLITPHQSPDMLTIGAVAKLLSVHENTVRNWSKNGKLPTFRLGKRRDRRFRRQDILNLLEAG